MNKHEEFRYLIGCMDGRLIHAVGRYCGDDYVDTCCDAGLVGRLVDMSSENRPELIERIKRQMKVSVEVHKSQVVYVAGHAECAGHPVSDHQHKLDIIHATAIVQDLATSAGYTLEIVPIWCERDTDGVWQAHILPTNQADL